MDRDPSDRNVVTAAELEAMTPQERHDSFHASIVLDLDTLPPAYLARLQAKSRETIARRDAEQSAKGGQRAS